LNGLYLNLRGRERNGIVTPAQRKVLLDEISQALLNTKDSATGLPVVTRMYERDETYQDRGRLQIGPDLLLGYGPHMQCAQGSAIGKVGGKLLSDNRDQWSGNHAMDHELVPGVLFSNRTLQQPVASLQQLAGALLAEFGVAGFPHRQTTGPQQIAEK
jgi:predicted AlkP superfamily phosphohydrolase/phosphomutase